MSSVRLPRRNLFRVFGGRAELLVGLLLATILEIRAAAAAEQADEAAPGQVPVDLAAIEVDPEAVRHFTPEQLKELLTPELLAKLGLAPEFAALIDSDFEGAIKKLEAAFREKLQAAGSEGRLAAVDGEVSDDDVDPQGDHALGLSPGLTPLLIIGGIAIAGGALVLALDDGDDEETVAEQAPVAANDSFTTNEDAAVTINVRGNDTDVNGDTLTVTQVNGTAITGQNSVNVTGGVVTLVNGNLVFTPNANYNGTPSFTYTVSDGKGGTSTATVSGTVTPVNDAPANVVPAAPVAAVQGVAVAIGGLSVADVDGAGNFTVTLSVGSGALTAGAVAGGATVAGSGTGTVTLTGTLAQVNASLGGISFNGGPAFNGATTLTMTTSDGQATDTDSFAINVTRVASGIVQDGYVRDATVFIDVNGNGALDAGEPSAVTDANGNFSIASNAVGSIVALGGTNIDTGLPNTVVLKAPAGSTVINPITTLVAAVVEGGASLEAAKAIVNQALGIPANVDVTGFDFLAPASTPEQAQLALDVQKTATQIVTLINNAAEAARGGAAGEAIKAAVLDSLVNSVETGAPVDLTKLETVQTILATVPNLPPAAAQAAANTTTAINQAIESATSAGGIAQTVVQLEAPGADLPPVTVTDTVNLAEDGAAVTFNVLANDVDPEGGNLTLTAINGTAVQVGDTVQVTGGTILVGQNGALTFQPGANFNGTPTFVYTVADPGGKTQSGTVELDITPLNDVPVSANDSFTTNEDAAVTIDVRGNDTDAEGDALTVTQVNGTAITGQNGVNVTGGVVTLVDGNLVFTPDANYNGTPSFTYTVSDGKGGTSTATVSGTVTAVNDAPISANDSFTTNEDAAVTIDIRGNDSDADGDALTVTQVNGTAITGQNGVNVTGGVVTLVNGNLVFTPDANYNGTPSFTYTVSDGKGGTSTATVSGTVTAVNDAPVSANDSFTTDIHAPVTIDVRANDGDADGDSLTVTQVNGRPVSTTIAVAITGGSVILDASGNLVFTPADGYVGAPSFNYTVSDAWGATATGTVTGEVQLPGGEISVTPAQLPGVVANAAALAGAGLEQLSVIGGSASLSAEQALQLEAANLDIVDSIDLTLNVSQSGVDQFAADPSALDYLDVDHLDLAGDTATITDLQASALVDAGVDFADGDTVTLDAASGTHLSTSLKDLQTLHVDAVLVTGAGLTIDAGGSLESLTADSLPSFSGGAGAGAVTLNLDGAPIDPGLDVAPIAAALAAAGIDQLSATGASLTMTDEQAASFLAAGIGVQDSTDFTLAASSVELDTVLGNTALLAGFGVDHIDLTDNSITLTEDQAAGMVAAGVDFADGDTVTLSAGGTQLSTSLKDLQTLHVDAVLVTGSQMSVDAGGALDTLTADSLPVFESAGDTDVTINVDSGTLDPSFDLGSLASAFHTAGIDHIGVIGDGSLGLTGAQALALGDHGIGFDAGADVTVSLSGAELTQLTPLIGDLNIDHLDMAGDTALISDSDAVALVDAGVDFATGDMVTVEAQGTHLSSTLKGLHDLNVDTIRVEAGVSALHLDAGDLAGISADDLPQFDIDQSDTSLDVTLRVDAAALGEVERLAAALRAAGIDHFAVDQPIGSYDAATQAQMQAIADASGIDFVFEEPPATFASTMMVSSMVEDQQADPSLYRELLSSFEAHDDLGTGGEFVLVDGTVHSLFEAGMLRAYTADSLVVDATGGDDLILTSLRDIADMGVTHVLLPEFQDSPVYVDIGEMLPGNELDEVRHLFEALEERAAPGGLFEGNEKIALVVDSDVAHALSQVEGALDKLATLGFTELDVLLTNGAAAPFEASTAMEVKLIGQDDDLYRHLHHDR